MTAAAYRFLLGGYLCSSNFWVKQQHQVTVCTCTGHSAQPLGFVESGAQQESERESLSLNGYANTMRMQTPCHRISPCFTDRVLAGRVTPARASHAADGARKRAARFAPARPAVECS